MFLRWKYRQLRHSPDRTLRAILVRSVRLEGQPHPCQQIVCYLASIRERYRYAPAHRHMFWLQVEQRLMRLPLDAPTRQRLERQLTAVIPRPTATELHQVSAQAALLAQMAGQIQDISTAPDMIGGEDPSTNLLRSAPQGALQQGMLQADIPVPLYSGNC